MKEKYAVIVAGGKGLRMGGDLPKQFVCIGGMPVLMHTISRFKQYDKDIAVILVLPEAQMRFWSELCEEYDFRVPHKIVAGGSTRFHSVFNGLQRVPDGAVVAVHDGVRPFVSVETISEAFSNAEKVGTAVPIVDLVDSVREITPCGNAARDRSLYKLVQTPQVFLSSILKNAYSQPYCDQFTDDASVVESIGVEISLTSGNRDNFKITTPFDLVVAEAILK